MTRPWMGAKVMNFTEQNGALASLQVHSIAPGEDSFQRPHLDSVVSHHPCSLPGSWLAL